MKKLLALILVLSFAISCGGTSKVGGPLIPKPKEQTPHKINLMFEIYGGKDEDYVSSATFNITYKEDYFATETKEEKQERIAKYGDNVRYTLLYLGSADAKLYPNSKIVVEIFPSIAHNIKSVFYDSVEQVVKDNKVEIVLEKKDNDNNLFNYRYITVAFEIKDEYLEEPIIVGNEYQISTAKQLRWIASRGQRGENFKDKTVKLMNDIDMENKNFSGISSGFGRNTQLNIFFAGTFDGNYKKIKNLKIWYDDNDILDDIGLIGALSSSGIVKNLTISSGNIEGFTDIGIIGQNFGLIENVVNYATVRGFARVGGIVGYSLGNVKDSINNADITAYGEVGGIVGFLDNCSSIKNSVNNGNIKSENKNVGQIFGYSYKDLGILENNIENGAATDGIPFD